MERNTMGSMIGPLKLKLLGIAASPRGNGNSVFLLEETIKRLDAAPFEVESKTCCLAGKKIFPCNGCLACYKNGGKCVLNDDFEAIREMWIDADVVLYSLPVYHAGVPGQLKCFFDRLGNSFYGYYATGPARHMKVVGSISQGGVPMGGQEMSNLYIMTHAALMYSFFVAGDSGHMGTGLVSGRGGNRSAFKEKAETEEKSYLEQIAVASNMLRRMVETAAIIRTGIWDLREILTEDAHYLPFIKQMEK
jgi:multimeric flavodoxin WrbA